eukprot:CAMPEP_0175071044 /NCGR_PEP_ID=MMETSP0052_2-20121109/19029_1 /TAXON_ID=51329 ORGANISM="Polytomella parva, Strain SAG 63-3" /NCGR_SAMPLE_ID=MMETSP0052_2 /ASSEMBLY_ACC=CAM_ASM_000194 /LENGTH=288 /DNA_ID=CAMNT_0016338181 /DNA_START=662 /DNA_END=1524 /DNA_ORIENTATION=+
MEEEEKRREKEKDEEKEEEKQKRRKKEKEDNDKIKREGEATNKNKNNIHGVFKNDQTEQMLLQKPDVKVITMHPVDSPNSHYPYSLDPPSFDCTASVSSLSSSFPTTSSSFPPTTAPTANGKKPSALASPLGQRRICASALASGVDSGTGREDKEALFSPSPSLPPPPSPPLPPPADAVAHLLAFVLRDENDREAEEREEGEKEVKEVKEKENENENEKEGKDNFKEGRITHVASDFERNDEQRGGDKEEDISLVTSEGPETLSYAQRSNSDNINNNNNNNNATGLLV